MNSKKFTQKVLALSVLAISSVSMVFGQAEYSRSKAEMRDKAFSPNTTNQRQFTKKPAAKINPLQIGKVERINKAPGDTLFFQPFNSLTWPSDMPRVNRDGRTPANATWMGTNAWVVRNNFASDPGSFAVSTSWYNPAGQADDWMITPPITITEGNFLNWKAKAFEAAFPDGYEVRVCTNCPTTFNNGNVLTAFSTVLFSVDAEQAGPFAEREVDLAAYQGQTVRFAFRNNSDDMNLLFIDDILVYKKPAIDIAAEQIFSPSNLIYDCSRQNFPAVASISNKGGSTVYNIKVKLTSVGALVDSVVETIDSLPKGMSDTIVFSGTLNVSQLGNYELILEVKAEGDEIPGNNTGSSAYLHRAPESGPFATNFNELNADSTLPQEWFSNTLFLPINEEQGFNGSTSIELPVFNNLGNFGSFPVCELVTSKFKNLDSTTTLSFKYLLQGQQGEYTMQDGDSILVKVWKNCQLMGNALEITSTNHEVLSSYRKMFIPLSSFNITADDEVTIQFVAKAAPTTTLMILELDDFKLGAADSNNISIYGVEKLPFSQVKRLHLSTFNVKGNIFNEGANAIAPVTITATANPGALLSGANINTLPAGFSRSFSTSPNFTFPGTGDYNVVVDASSPGLVDQDPTDNSLDFDLSVTDSTMAKDFGDPIQEAFLQYGATSGGKRIIANAIPTVARDTLTSVSVFIGPLAGNCVLKAFFANRNAAGTGWVEDSSAVAVTVTVDEQESWIPLRFWKATPAAAQRGRAVLPNTTNLYGIKIRQGNPRVGFNFENATAGGAYIWLGGQFLGTEDITLGTLRGPFQPFIRANFGRPSTLPTSTNQAELSIQNVEIVPNPAQGAASLLYAGNAERAVSIKVYSLNGLLLREESRQAMRGTNRFDIPVSGLPRGMYIVRIEAGDFSTSKKLILE